MNTVAWVHCAWLHGSNSGLNVFFSIIFGIFNLTHQEEEVCVGGTHPMLLLESSCACIPRFRPVAPCTFLVKVPFLNFFNTIRGVAIYLKYPPLVALFLIIYWFMAPTRSFQVCIMDSWTDKQIDLDLYSIYLLINRSGVCACVRAFMCVELLLIDSYSI